ncbi:hypothetical protein DERP_007247, partial [Dermatophagoides pteronyssinus]
GTAAGAAGVTSCAKYPGIIWLRNVGVERTPVNVSNLSKKWIWKKIIIIIIIIQNLFIPLDSRRVELMLVLGSEFSVIKVVDPLSLMFSVEFCRKCGFTKRPETTKCGGCGDIVPFNINGCEELRFIDGVVDC